MLQFMVHVTCNMLQLQHGWVHYTGLVTGGEGESGVWLGWAPGTAAGGCQGDR